MSANKAQFNVGGALLDRPFKVRRLGHFGVFSNHMEEAKRFYFDCLGFQIADPVDLAPRAKTVDQLAGLGDTRIYFARHGTDHHSFVLFPRAVFESVGTRVPPRVTVNQITWQVGSLQEVVDANDWLNGHNIPTHRSGRDTPGSNWHCYMRDPDGNTNEIYYGIEQIGWNGRSKPAAMYSRGFSQTPPLPQIAERQEIDAFTTQGVDLAAGYRPREDLPYTYEVGGIMMPRPFKVTAIGPIRLFVSNLEASLRFYTQSLGFVVTEETTWKGSRCVFLRSGAEHHSLALYPEEVRRHLGIAHDSYLFSFGIRVNDYSQLRGAIAFLKEKGFEIRYMPAELLPGMDYTAFAVDPDGHLVQIYSYMEQIGWNGKSRPASERLRVDNDAWPETVSPPGDAFAGEPFLGPWA